MSDSIIIADYNSNWPEIFETLRARIATTLGPLAAAIEHVGSTAVPGLASKPIIDLDVLLRAPTDLPEAITRLVALGYGHRGNLGIAGREAFQGLPNDPPHHLYVCSPDSVAFREHIAFRDHLRTHFEDAKAYTNLKRTLATQHATDREAYTQAKTDFIRHILGQNCGQCHGTSFERATYHFLEGGLSRVYFSSVVHSVCYVLASSPDGANCVPIRVAAVAAISHRGSRRSWRAGDCVFGDHTAVSAAGGTVSDLVDL